MELIFIIGIVTILIIKYMTDAFNKVPKSESKTPMVKKIYTNYESNSSDASDLLINKKFKTDIQEDKRVKKIKSNSNIFENNITKNENIKSQKNISLSNIDEAKRAFIYSEIFNRKY